MALDLADIQGNLLRGYRFTDARHFALGISEPRRRAPVPRRPRRPARSGDRPQITTDEHWTEKPKYCLNIGLTWAGLQALGVPAAMLGGFPRPRSSQGPAARAGQPDPDFPGGVGLGDVGDSAPRHWVLGGAATPPVHILLSLYTEEQRARQPRRRSSARLRKLFAAAQADRDLGPRRQRAA